MARIFLFIAVIALTVFAIADWVARSKQRTPGGVNRWIWLAVVVLLPVVGPLAWVIAGAVARAEATQQQAAPPRALAPDDDPDAISDLAERIARRSKRTREQPPRTLPTEPGALGEESAEETAERNDDAGN